MGSPADVAACKRLRMVHRQALYMRLIKASDVVDFIHVQHAKFDGRGKHRDKLLQQLEQHVAFATMMHMPTPTPAAAAPAPQPQPGPWFHHLQHGAQQTHWQLLAWTSSVHAKKWRNSMV